MVDKPTSDAATADVVDTFSAPADKFTLEELTLPRLPNSIQRSSMRRQSSAFEVPSKDFPSNGPGSSHVRRQSSAFELAALIKLRYFFSSNLNILFNSRFNDLTKFLSCQIIGRTISIVGSQLVPASSKEILLSKIWLVNSRSLNRPLRKNSNRKYQEITNGCQYRLPFCPRHLCRNKISKISSKCLLHLRRHQFEHQQFKR